MVRSPHVHHLRERFRLDGGAVPAELVDAALGRIRPAVEAVERAGHGRPSFAVTNAIAFGLFADRVDHGLIETGVGGLLDSTNTISRADELAVITPIGLDHQDLLGATLPEIPAQKAGILPSGGRAVGARQGSPEVEDVLGAEAARRARDLRWVDPGPRRCGPGPGRTAPNCSYGANHLCPRGRTGRHQAGSAHLALRTGRGPRCRRAGGLRGGRDGVLLRRR